MVIGQNWILFKDKLPLSSIPGRTAPKVNFCVVVATKINNILSYSVMSAEEATNTYDSSPDMYAWKFIDPCHL